VRVCTHPTDGETRGDVQPERFEINGQVIDETIDGETIIINLASGNYYNLNASGAAAWRALRRRSTADELAAYLSSQFDAPPDDIRAGVDELIARLRDEGLVSPTDRPADGQLPGEQGGRSAWVSPALGKYTDMQDLILLDPVHEVTQDQGWPHHPDISTSEA
jgi:hypothetical protein